MAYKRRLLYIIFLHLCCFYSLGKGAEESIKTGKKVKTTASQEDSETTTTTEKVLASKKDQKIDLSASKQGNSSLSSNNTGNPNTENGTTSLNSTSASDIHFITFTLKSSYIKFASLLDEDGQEGKDFKLMESDLKLELEQILKKANKGVQLKPSHIKLDIKVENAMTGRNGMLNVEVMIAFNSSEPQSLVTSIKNILSDQIGNTGRVVDFNLQGDTKCECSLEGSNCLASCGEGLKLCEEKSDNATCFAAEICRAPKPCENEWKLLRSDLEMENKNRNENMSEILLIREVASRLVDVALGSISNEMNGKHFNVLERYLEVSIRNSSNYWLRPQPSSLDSERRRPAESVASIDLFLKVANESEVTQISQALSLAFSNHITEDNHIDNGNLTFSTLKSHSDNITFSNLKSQMLAIDQCYCNVTESTGKCSVPCGNGKIIHTCPDLRWCIKLEDICTNRMCKSGEWTAWTSQCTTPCSKTCGGGICKRTRQCINKENGGVGSQEQCEGSDVAYTLCNTWDCEEACTGGRIHFAGPQWNPEAEDWNWVRNEKCSCGCHQCLSKELNIAMSFEQNGNQSEEGVKPEMAKALTKGIEITLNSIWNEGNKTADKRNAYPDILQLNVSVNSFQEETSKSTEDQKILRLNVTVQLLAKENGLSPDSVDLCAQILTKKILAKPEKTEKTTTTTASPTTTAAKNSTTSKNKTEEIDKDEISDVTLLDDVTRFEEWWNKNATSIFDELLQIIPGSLEIESNESCFYCAQWVWPELSNEIFFEISTKDRILKGQDEKVWNAIGFSNGTNMADGIDAVLAVRFGWNPRGDFVQNVWFGDYTGPFMSTSRPAKRGFISSEDGFTKFSFSKLVAGDGNTKDINFNDPVNILFPISGGSFHYHNSSVPHGLHPKLDARKHFMNAPFILPNVTIRQCSTRKKPVDGHWSPWSSWSKCSATCGDGTTVSRRFCDTPPSRHGGKNCKGENQRTEMCLQKDCTSCSPDVRDMFWYPENCLDVETLTCKSCQFVAMWEFKPGHSYIDFVVRTSTRDKWTGIAIKPHNDAMTKLFVGYVPPSSNEEGYIGEYNLVNGFTDFLTQNILPEKTSHFTDESQNEPGFNVREISVNDLEMIEMRIRLKKDKISPKGADEFQVDLTFIVIGGPLGYRGRNMFDIAKDTSVYFLQHPNVTIQRCLGNGVELPGSEISCYKCLNDGCGPNSRYFPGQKKKCGLGVFTCQKFFGFVNSRRQFYRICGPRHDTTSNGCSKFQGLVMDKYLDGEICTCNRPLCNQRASVKGSTLMTIIVAIILGNLFIIFEPFFDF